MKKYVLQQNPYPKMDEKEMKKKVKRFVKRILWEKR